MIPAPWHPVQSSTGEESGPALSRPWSADLASLLRLPESDPSLFEAGHFAQRMALLDRLELIVALADTSDLTANESPLLEQANALVSRLEAANAAMFAHLRSEIQSGRGPRVLHPWIGGETGKGSGIKPGLSFDWRDDLVAGVLQLEEPDSPPDHPGPEMVFYQPTPARHILEMLRLLKPGPDEVFIDLGAGLGHVALLTAIATSARFIGIELESAYIASARRSAAQLGLANVAFIESDVREADFSAGTQFYLYTPFTGALLRGVLARLGAEARQRPIRIGAFGPCIETLANEAWLEPERNAGPGRISVFRSLT